MNKKKLILLLFFVGLIFGAFFLLKDTEYLTLDYIKEQQGNLQGLYYDHPVLFVLIYMGVYITVTALSIPGAAIMTLLGGAIFGLLAGTIIVSFASTIGATCAFLVTRYLLRNYIGKKFPNQLTKINAGILKEGFFYLFALRLIPIFPFFLINILFGLTSLPAKTFFWVSQLGMLPGTIAYVNAGKELGQLTSLSGILSPGILVAFAILGLIPLISKWFVIYLRKRRILGDFKKPKKFDYNLVVIGAGSGGLVSAYIAAALKAKVALIERDKMGGDCLNTGCVPSKALIRVSKLLSDIKNAKKFGLDDAPVTFDFAKVMEHVQRIIKKIEPHDSVERYTKLGVNCIHGEAKVISPWEIEVNGKIISTRAIILATGGSPNVPSIPGIEDVPYLTSDTIWDIREQPKHLLVLGGGPIGCELAQTFSRLGSRVTLVQRSSHILPREDADAARLLHEHMEQSGVRILTSCSPLRFENNLLICKHDGEELFIEFDQLLVATGRKSNLEHLKLEKLGLQLNERGFLPLEPSLRTQIPNIFVVGDAAGMHQFTHAASHHAQVATTNALFGTSLKPTYHLIPWCTFTDPEIAHVGLSEHEAKEQNIAYEVTIYPVSDLDRAIADVEDYGFVKVLTPPKSPKILGATIISTHAGELIHEFILAIKHKLTLNHILNTIHIYPTHSEANKYIAGAWNRATALKLAI